MTRRNDTMVPDLYADPFRERARSSLRVQMQLLGARIQFESNSARLLQLVKAAFAGLPRHRLSASTPQLLIRLILRPSASLRPHRRREPPALDMFSGSSWLGAATQASDFVVLAPRQRTALVVISAQTLKFPYHARYELIEFAVFTLAARCQQLVSLHAACVGIKGRGVLLMGPSGSGKSTITMLCLHQGFNFLSEDSVFVAPRSMRATGIANFLHVRGDSLKWIGGQTERAIRRSPVIQRRSGVRKYELDLRSGRYTLASSPLKITSIVFLSPNSARGQQLLRPLSREQLSRKLTQTQAYAVNQPQWPGFASKASTLKAFELQRGWHPNESVDALRGLLESH